MSWPDHNRAINKLLPDKYQEAVFHHGFISISFSLEIGCLECPR